MATRIKLAQARLVGAANEQEQPVIMKAQPRCQLSISALFTRDRCRTAVDRREQG